MSAAQPAKSRVREWLAVTLLVVYLSAVLVVVFWPSPVDLGWESAIDRLLAVMHRHGVPEWFGYNKLEFTANIAMFVPLAFLVALVLPARVWWLAVIASAAFSVFIEVTQGALLEQRFATPWDVLANSIGAVIGTLIAVVLRAIVYHRDQRVIARALWQKAYSQPLA